MSVNDRPHRMSGFLECYRDEKGDLQFPRLKCPLGHNISWEFAFHEAGYPRCPFMFPRHARGMMPTPCDARLFIQFFPRMNKGSNPLLFVAEITVDEIKHVTRAEMDVPAIMEYLGITWAPKPGRAA